MVSDRDLACKVSDLFGCSRQGVVGDHRGSASAIIKAKHLDAQEFCPYPPLKRTTWMEVIEWNGGGDLREPGGAVS